MIKIIRRARTYDSPPRRTRDEERQNRILVAQFPAETHVVENDGGMLKVFATPRGMDPGVMGATPAGLTTAKEFKDSRRVGDARRGLVADMNRKARDFWTRQNGAGGR